MWGNFINRRKTKIFDRKINLFVAIILNDKDKCTNENYRHVVVIIILNGKDRCTNENYRRAE